MKEKAGELAKAWAGNVGPSLGMLMSELQNLSPPCRRMFRVQWGVGIQSSEGRAFTQQQSRALASSTAHAGIVSFRVL